MASIEIKNLCYKYPRSEEFALTDVGFELDAGELLLVVGKTGSGKTALAKALLDKFGSRAGCVPQSTSVQVTDTVIDEVCFPACRSGMSGVEIRRRAAEAMGRLGISDLAQRKIDDLSGGERQLVSLAAATITSPELLVLDEPTANLSPFAASTFISSLTRYIAETGSAAVLIEHRSEELFRLADKVMIIDDGKMIFFGCPADACRYCGDNRLYDLIPSPAKLGSLLDGGELPLSVAEARRIVARRGKMKDMTAGNAASGDILLRARGVTFRYEKKQPDVLSRLDLDLKKGEHLAIFGENGSGKSTLLRVLAGLSRAYAGKISFDGRAGLLPQDVRSVFLYDTVRAELESLSLPLGEFECYADRHPFDLSGGEARLLAIKMILSLSPSLILLDEPTGGLDAIEKRKLAERLNSLKKEGVSVISVTHDTEFAAMTADSCDLLFGGNLIGKTPVREFLGGGGYYSTVAARIASGYCKNVLTVEELAEVMNEKN